MIGAPMTGMMLGYTSVMHRCLTLVDLTNLSMRDGNYEDWPFGFPILVSGTLVSLYGLGRLPQLRHAQQQTARMRPWLSTLTLHDHEHRADIGTASALNE